MINTLLLTMTLLVPSSPSDLDKAVILSREGSHEASEELLKKVKDQSPTYRFYKMINAYKLNKKDEVIKWADSLLYAFSGDEIPIRYHDMAIICKADAETWKDDADDLGDISREMTKIKDRLDNKMGGPQTQKLQKDVLDRLGKMIKDIEDQKAAAQAAAEKEEAEKHKKIESTPSPAQDTVKGSESGSGMIDSKRVREIAEVWGKLPEKERAKALVELTRRMPAKDRAVIEAYFRELAKKKGR